MITMYIERVTEKNFSESEYLCANPDVRLAVQQGLFESGLDYFTKHPAEVRFQYKCEDSSPTEIFANEGKEKNLLKHFKCELEDLSDTMGERYSNIWGIKGFSRQEKQGISSQFLEDSETYHQYYFNPDGVLLNLKKALESAGLQYRNPSIFDLGSGSGNSVFACIKQFNECNILATDLSQELLVILNRIRTENYPEASVRCVAVDAMSVEIEPVFDIFLGSSILHHIIDVEQVFKTAYSSLNETGCAIFFEPMLSGITVSTTLFQLLLHLNESKKTRIRSLLRYTNF